MNVIFVAVVGLGCAVMLGWGFAILPRENYQFIASVPLARDAAGRWRGLNLTWYGILTAVSVMVATLLFQVLAGAAGLDGVLLWATGAALLAISAPAARLVARVVEGKRHTFTIGGAVFVGFLVAPLLVAALNATLGRALGRSLPLVPLLAAAAVAYAFGEGLGRLACVSFGCCYGKSVASLPAALRPLFQNFHFVFHGSTRKIAYASTLAGKPVVPVQALTALAHCSLGLLGTGLLLEGHGRLALVVAMAGTQVVRVASEFLRADHRGGRFGLTTYQWMALVVAAGAVVIAAVASPMTAPPSLLTGLTAVWTPGVVLALVAVFVAVFLFTGRSEVTTSRLDFEVLSERI